MQHLPTTNGVTLSLLIMSLVGGFGMPNSAKAQGAMEAPTDTVVLSAVLAADNRRDGSDASLATLLAGAQAADQLTRRLAIRAMGRVEMPEWIPHIRPALSAEMHELRQEAVSAIGQAASRGDARAALDALEPRVGVERHPAVLGTLARTIGSLPLDPADWGRAEAAILRTLGSGDSTMAPYPREVALGVVAGLEALARQTRRGGGGGSRFRGETAHALRELARFGLSSNPPDSTTESARVRRLATGALLASGSVDRTFYDVALADPDADVRRQAYRGLGTLSSVSDRFDIIMRAPMDVSWSVRFEILRAYGLFAKASNGCAPIVDALGDQNPHVFLLAVDLLGDGCAPDGDILRVLTRLVSVLPSDRSISTGWQFSAHALVALARMSPATAREYLPTFARHPQWQVRMYAARAAAFMREDSMLTQLAQDTHPNVVEAALDGLQTLRGHRADELYVRALSTSDYQLMRTAAQALAGTPMGRPVLRALLDALARVSAEHKETSRDARVPLVARIGELGDSSVAGEVSKYLTDFDPVIADSAAAMLTRWTGRSVVADPASLAAYPIPSIARLFELRDVVALVEMRDGGSFELALRPFDAPTNTGRFAQLATSGYFNGLSFHRVEPNFVIQGGSPGANEYAGDGRYTRDELTDAFHWRGTVGVSTRGRNTGDGQIFVNLVDNVRLDHNYTIFAEVTRGMDTVDNILEGAEIARITMGRKDR